jgi:hypothetical protein
MGDETEVVTTGSVVSADGTRIGYRRLGRGPSVILLHGGVNASQHMVKLGRALADAFTVYLPDRRGRGMSGAFGAAYGIQREDEDLAAVSSTPPPSASLDRPTVACSPFMEPSGSGRSGGWPPMSRCCCVVDLTTLPSGTRSPRCSR